MKKEAVIKIAGSRIEAGFYHNEGGKHLPKREWFGVSKKAQNDSRINTQGFNNKTTEQIITDICKQLSITTKKEVFIIDSGPKG